MATTSLWRIKGSIGRVIEYAESPEKTMGEMRIKIPEGPDEDSLEDVISYAAREDATLQRRFVIGINCDPETAREEMLATKKKFGKPGGTIAYHGYQSFAEGEVTPEQAQLIGRRLAEELWGDRYEVIVATHVDKESHIHNHFVINTVSFVDGIKFHRTNDDYRRMQEASDRLCREYGLSVIRHPEDGKGKSYAEWSAEKNGKPTYRSMIRKDIDAAIKASLTENEFFSFLESKGYEFKLYSKRGQLLERPSLRPEGAERFFRFDRLGDEYDLEEIRYRIIGKMERELPFSPEETEKVRRYRREHPPRPKARGLAALYYHYCYELHIIRKYPASVKRVSFFMLDDIRKLDSLDEQTRLLGENGIETADDLERFIRKTDESIAGVTDERKHLTLSLKEAVNVSDDVSMNGLKKQISSCTEEIKRLRNVKKLCEKIRTRSGRIAEQMEVMKEVTKDNGKEKDDGLLRGSSGTGREDVTERH